MTLILPSFQKQNKNINYKQAAKLNAFISFCLSLIFFLLTFCLKSAYWKISRLKYWFSLKIFNLLLLHNTLWIQIFNFSSSSFKETTIGSKQLGFSWVPLSWKALILSLSLNKHLYFVTLFSKEKNIFSHIHSHKTLEFLLENI